MRALRLAAPSRFEEVDAPPPRPDDLPPGTAIIRTLAGGVCGSDLPLFRGRSLPDIRHSDELRYGPRPLGFPLHEIVGTVIASRSSLEVGQRVVGWARRTDGLQQQLVVDEAAVLVVSADDDPARQVVIQPLACVIHAVDRLGALEGRSCAVLGQGPIGALFAEVLAARGASRVTSVDRVGRVDGPCRFGIDEFVHESTDRWAHHLTDDAHADVVVDAIGHDPGVLNDAIAATADEGIVYAFGGVDDVHQAVAVRMLQRHHLTLVSGTTPAAYRKKALSAAEAFLRSRPELVEAFVTRTFDVQRAQEAFDAAATPTRGQLKVVVTWS